jgi:hydroxyacylglutathione hydrolase
VLPFDSEIVIVAERGQDVDEAHRQFTRIGFDRVRGVVFDLPETVDLLAYEVLRLGEFLQRMELGEIDQIIDVRAPDEWESGHIEGSSYRYAPDLFADASVVDPSSPAWLVCGTGYRATIAAAALESRGLTPAVLVGHGVTDVLASGHHTLN